ncbi:MULTISPECIES: hypothetical protein [Thalassobacillus]|uniref:hypothetical protein n=1 Tax=Thalassobacillus TaxID=331971 RepID=UPI000A1C9DF9|nr:hypothetical protein [Thalassobacillus devorans]
MWPILGILSVSTAVFFIEVPKLRKKDKKKDLVYFCIFLAAATIVSILESMGKNLYNPLDLIQAFYAPFNAWLQSIFP